MSLCYLFLFFFFNDTATTEIYTLSLHDALPISCPRKSPHRQRYIAAANAAHRSEEHTSELQSRQYLVCRLLLEKKKKKNKYSTMYSMQISSYVYSTVAVVF